MTSFRESYSYFTKFPAEHWTSRSGRRSPVMFHNKQYASATAALEDYISDFEGRPFSFQDKYEREWWELFTPPPPAISSMHRPTAANLSSEVKGALNASADLLRYLDDDDLPSPENVPPDWHQSSLGKQRVNSATSLGTDVLVAENPYCQKKESSVTVGTDQLIAADPYTSVPNLKKVKDYKGHRSKAEFGNEKLRAGKDHGNSSSTQNEYVLRVLDYTKAQSNYKAGSHHRNCTMKDGLSQPVHSLVDQRLHQQHNERSRTMDHMEVSAHVEPVSMGSAPSSIHEAADGSRYPPSWVRDIEGSEGSSIVTGYVLGHPVTSHSEAKKMASTPKHVAHKSQSAAMKKHLQFDLYSTKLGANHGQRNGEHMYMKDIQTVSSAKPSSKAKQTGYSHHGNRSAKSPEHTSPQGRFTGTSISSATDNLIFYPADATPRSVHTHHHHPGASASHPHNTSHRKQKAESPHSSPQHGANDVKYKQYLQDLIAEIESSSSVADPHLVTGGADTHLVTGEASIGLTGQPTTMGLEQLLQKYKSVQKILSPESEVGTASHIYTADSDVTSVGGVRATTDGDFLGRIQRLLSEPMSYPAQFLDTSQGPQTDSILDGDRSWEEHHGIKPPVPVTGRGSKESAVGDITSLSLDGADRTVNGGSHPGGLEALKQMLFTMQSLTDVGITAGMARQDSTEGTGNDHLPEFDVKPGKDSSVKHQQQDSSALLSPQTKQLLADTKTPGGDSMLRALEHLAKLKQLTASEVTPSF